jgi:parallel beta-helix repeat protein
MKAMNVRVLFILSLFLLTMTCSLPDNSHIETKTISEKQVTSQQEYIPSDTIRITNDSSFELHGFPGNGTNTNPYLIENYIIEINETSEYEWGVEVSGTESHFIIRNCYIKGDEVSLSTYGMGIYLYDTSNGRIQSNGFEDFEVSISIQGNVVNFTIDDNHFQGEADNQQRTTIGISLSGDNQDIRVNNNVFEDCTRGIEVFSSGITVSNNTMTNCYLGVILASSSSITITNNTIEEGEIGFHLQDSDDNLVSWNFLSRNNVGGYLVMGSDNNILTNNTFSLNQEKEGINNSGHGLVVSSASTNNSIVWNDFIDNVANIKNDVDANTFDFNYYSDYTGADSNADMIGDTSYEIAGDSPTQDSNPRIHPLLYEKSSEIETFAMVVFAGVVVCFVLVGFVVMKKR